MKTIDIKGKAYVTVNERIKYFREKFVDWRIITEIVSIDDDECIVRANIINPEGIIVANAHAQEYRAASNINKTSMLENGETSAIGRALGIFGIGIDQSVASADEVKSAIAMQELLESVPDYPAPKSASKDQMIDTLKEFKAICDGIDVDPIEFLYWTGSEVETLEDKYKAIYRWMRNKELLDQQLESYKLSLSSEDQ